MRRRNPRHPTPAMLRKLPDGGRVTWCQEGDRAAGNLPPVCGYKATTVRLRGWATLFTTRRPSRSSSHSQPSGTHVLHAIVEPIAATRTKTGLAIECVLDTRVYEKGIKIAKQAMKALDIRGDEFPVVPRRRPS